MKRVNSLVWGTVLLLLGVVLVLNQLNVLDVQRGMAFPIILLALAVLFHLYYFFSGRGNEGLLVPGGILLTYGLMFLISELYGDKGTIFHSGLWPLLILGPALGLFELYAFSRGAKGSMVPVFILTAIGGGFLLNTFLDVSFTVVLAIVLIGVGAGLMINAMGHRGQPHNTEPPRPSEPLRQEPPVVDVKPEDTSNHTSE